MTCSCGVVDCPELGWPHEWDPSIDDCVVCIDGAPLDVGDVEGPLGPVRWGSGYAHRTCVEDAPEVDEPLRWEGDDS